MKETFLQICRFVFGEERGHVEEGCHQWYYFTYIVMSVMLIWRNNPNVAPVYTTLLVVEYLIVCVYGFLSLVDKGIWSAFAYLAILAVICVACFILDWKVALLSSLIGVVGQLVAPDESGDSYTMHFSEDKPEKVLIVHAIWFGFYAFVAFLLPTDLGTRIIIVVATMLIHPVIDISEGNCMSYMDNLMDTMQDIAEYFDERKDRKYQKQKATKNDDTPS